MREKLTLLFSERRWLSLQSTAIQHRLLELIHDATKKLVCRKFPQSVERCKWKQKHLKHLQGKRTTQVRIGISPFSENSRQFLSFVLNGNKTFTGDGFHFSVGEDTASKQPIPDSTNHLIFHVGESLKLPENLFERRTSLHLDLSKYASP